jgi:hypothetical protein
MGIVYSAPGDATLPSLLLGIVLGLAGALLLLLPLAHSASEWAALGARMWAEHGNEGMALLVALFILACGIRLGLFLLNEVSGARRFEVRAQSSAGSKNNDIRMGTNHSYVVHGWCTVTALVVAFRSE